MKKTTFVLSAFLLATTTYNANAQRTCAAHDHLLEQMAQSPKMSEHQQELEEFTKDYVKSHIGHKAGETRIIPVHVIVVYATAQQNISEAQIQSQITVLNKDYGGTNSDLTKVPSEFNTVTANGTGIQFVLQSIERHSNSKTSWGTNDLVKTTYPPTNPTTTLNMWICNIGSGILGYAQFPGGAAATDGVVFSPQYCGSSDYSDGTFYLSAPFDKGRTTTHEVGHYLNLRHIWGDGNCSATDYVDDTPNAAAANYNCPTYPSKTCTSNGGWTSDMFMNYMDYTDDGCMFMFSDGQNARMWACLNSSRATLGTAGGNAAPVAKINGPYSGDAGVAIAFSSTGSSDADGNIASYFWNFGDGVTSSSANPTHAYTADGIYNVSLMVTDNEGSKTTATTTATIGNVCSGIQACSGAISFKLVTDKYASETSWTLKNSAGTTVQSGSSLANNTTYNLSWNLTEDTYTFAIADSYGDGICCTYGSGSYTITDACSTVIKTGGAYGTGESVVFCVPDAGTVPNVAPVANANGPYSGTTGTPITFSSTGSSDSDGTIASYLWNFGDGTTSNTASPSHTYTAAGTYTVTLTVTDDDAAATVASSTATITTATSSSVELLYETFESGWGNWTDGGADCARYTSSTYSYGGTSSIDIQDNTSTTASFYMTNGIDVHSPGYTSIEVEFYFYAVSMEAGEDFWVQYYNGSTWATVATYARGTQFNNTIFYSAKVTINESSYTFPTNMKIRFMCDASDNNDDVYIDNVKITGKTGSLRKGSENELVAVSSNRESMDNSDVLADELHVYPNPTGSELNIEVSVDDNTTALIVNSTGQVVKTISLTADVTTINVSELSNGLYFIVVNNGAEQYRTKFIKN